MSKGKDCKLMRTDEPLHFRKGFLGRLASFFQAADRLGDSYEETAILPALISWFALSLGDAHKISYHFAFIIYLASAVLAGAWLGVIWGFKHVIRAILRGITVGLIISALVLSTTSNSFSHGEAIKFGTQVTHITLVGFMLGIFLISPPLKQVLITTEEQWQVGLNRRRRVYAGVRGTFNWTLDVLKTTLLIRKLDQASLAQALLVWFIWSILLLKNGGSVFGWHWSEVREFIDSISKLAPSQ